MTVTMPFGASVRQLDDRAEVGAELDRTVAELYEKMSDEFADRVAVREELVTAALPFAVRLARHYQGRGEPFEDLVQVATVGLIKAIDGYDPERGPFTHYAGPTVRGELKKHFRDRGWSVRVPRRLQELKMEMSRANQALTNQLGRAPTVADLAGYLHVEEDQVVEGLDLAHAYQPVSLDAPISADEEAGELATMLGERDPALESVVDRMTVANLLPRLPEREQRILHMRFSGNMTQSQIAAEIGISQMHVSRLLSQTLAWLREAMTCDGQPSSPVPAGAARPVEEEAPLRIDMQRLVGGRVVVAVAGELDHDTAPLLHAALCEAALVDRPREVCVDLAQVPLVDAAGVAALVAGYRAARHGGARFHLDRVRLNVREVLHHAGVDALLRSGSPSAAAVRHATA